MSKKQEKIMQNANTGNLNNSSELLLKALTKEQTMQLLFSLVKNMKDEFAITNDEIMSQLQYGGSKYKIPIDIFANDLSPAESLVKYMKENLTMKYSEIARELNRDDRGIWSTYNIGSKKHPLLFESKSDIFVPCDIFKDRRFSVLENLIIYLKEEKNIEIKDIATKLVKTQSTIYTVYRRARIKIK
ncbi:MAG: hypothetical protein WC755_02850 [Candidatus Woesearchaeota archaeon]|jgi:hypothetical protein